MEPPKTEVRLRQFQGLVLSTDSHQLPPGAAQIQENVISLDEARLQTRGGLKLATFEWSAVE